MVRKLEGVKPTRMELLAVRKKKQLAKNGHKLLSEKRDALITQFFTLIEEREKLRAKVERELREAYEALTLAEMYHGKEGVRDAARGMHPYPELPLTTVNLMGVIVPQIAGEVARVERSLLYASLETSAALDDAAIKFREALADLIRLAEMEGAIESLGHEIEKTKRRVNALEHIFIPRLEATEKYIKMVLEEREREDFFRRKKIKAVMARREGS